MNTQSLASAAVVMAIGVSTLPCSSSASLRGSQEPMLDFEVTGSSQTAAPTEPTIQSATAAAVEIAGTISTPNPCYEISAELTEEDGALELTLTARSTGGICPQVIANFDYRARITGLAAGDYELVTVYRYPETGWEEQRHSLQVQVPEGGR
ncbi:MAG: hypothetical protein GWN99_13040 [Gemmatimonadetes bacterium]|uniref:Uncharacterized protein n=1 Tax=Candidatus Kutchimonas denitrificans TaxID=3056748 RepID=A0AAE4Z8J3_9BACT|nr:hypothetical protein [Gemmatimonadota bacterium]NIR75804.1 hypothetical protein [Candidatus Kutchimonas denitrificans]NIS01972.1 hypothetical protein [Gemmatimonadota bacterium]NIT67776.1 hypothetical protein [Gemmatimonadota bacterium]NIU53763.1 hypothetical protein [Gemmatimonadota bacterium]